MDKYKAVIINFLVEVPEDAALVMNDNPCPAIKLYTLGDRYDITMGKIFRGEFEERLRYQNAEGIADKVTETEVEPQTALRAEAAAFGKGEKNITLLLDDQIIYAPESMKANQYRPYVFAALSLPEVAWGSLADNDNPAISLSTYGTQEGKRYDLAFGKIEKGKFQQILSFEDVRGIADKGSIIGLEPEAALRAEANAFGNGAENITLILNGKTIYAAKPMVRKD